MEKICKFMAETGHCENEDCTGCGSPCFVKLGESCDLFVQAGGVMSAFMAAQAARPAPSEPAVVVPEVVQAEVVEAAPAPAPAAAETFAVTLKHRTVQLPPAQALSIQFAKVGKAAGAAVREMVVFGAMLEKVDDGLTRNRHNPDGTGVSLKSWLSENCPEINYNTAKSYQRAAEGVRVLAKMADDVPLLPLMGAEPIADETLRKTREEILGVISSSSLNVLRRAALPMPVGNKLKGTHGIAQGRRALTAEEEAAEAEKMRREILGSLGAYLRGNWFGMLTLEGQDDMLGTLKHYVQTVEDKMRAAALAR